MKQMKSLYQAAANAAGTAIGAAGQDIEVFKIVVGAPVSAGNISLYDNTNPGSASNTTGLKAKFTFPGSLTGVVYPCVFNLTDENGNGLVLGDGGSIIIDQTMNVSVLYAEDQE